MPSYFFMTFYALTTFFLVVDLPKSFCHTKVKVIEPYKWITEYLSAWELVLCNRVFWCPKLWGQGHTCHNQCFMCSFIYVMFLTLGSSLFLAMNNRNLCYLLLAEHSLNSTSDFFCFQRHEVLKCLVVGILSFLCYYSFLHYLSLLFALLSFLACALQSGREQCAYRPPQTA